MEQKSATDVKFEFIIKELEEIKAKLENKYVTAEEFKPVKSIVYSMVAIILTSVVGALIALVVK